MRRMEGTRGSELQSFEGLFAVSSRISSHLSLQMSWGSMRWERSWHLQVSGAEGGLSAVLV